MPLRAFRLPTDLSLMAELLPAAFQYPENPEWGLQSDEVDGILRLVASARRLWPLFALMMRVSPMARDVLLGYVWEEDGQPVGMVNVSRDGTTDDWMIANVAVLPAYRHRGIARALVEAAVALAREHHAAHVLLDVIAGNTPAYDLYVNMGFTYVSSSVTLRHAAPAPEASTEPRLPVGYTSTSLLSGAWRPYFALAERITPAEIQRFHPVVAQQFHWPAGLRAMQSLLNLATGVRERGMLVTATTARQDVAAFRLTAHTGANEMNACTLWLDPAHREVAPYLVRSALALSRRWSPRSRVEVSIPSWESALIDAAKAIDFAPTLESYSLGMAL